MDQPNPLRYGLLLVDDDPSVYRRLAEAGPTSAFRWECITSCGPMPSQKETESLLLALIAEDCLRTRQVVHWGTAAVKSNGVQILVGRSRLEADGLPSWVHGVVGRPYDPMEIHAHAVRAFCRHLHVGSTRVHEVSLIESQRTLVARGKELKDLEQRVAESRQALGLLAARIDAEGREAFQRVQEAVRTWLLPVIRDMANDPKTAEVGRELEEFSLCALKGIGEPNSVEGRMISRLSATELRVAVLIRLGVPGHRIASTLGISQATLQTHRKNIRKKLGICGKPYSLRHSLRQGSRERARERSTR